MYKLGSALLLITTFALLQPGSIKAATFRVPQTHPTIAAAYAASVNGDEIIVSPGTYSVCLTNSNKKISIKAEFPATSSSPSQFSILNSACSHVVLFTTPLDSDGIFQPGDHFEFSGFVLNGSDDGVSYQAGSGIVQNNHITGQTDDPIDVDAASEIRVFGNILGPSKGGGDGLENRLHSFSSTRDLNMVIMDNIIYSNPKDGLQFIGIISTLTRRKYLIANNLIINNGQVGLGTTGNAVSDQALYPNGYPLPEKMYILNNTIVGNGMGGILGGANMQVHNNIFYQNKGPALKNVAGQSVASYNLFFENTGGDNVGSNVQNPNILANPNFVNTAAPPNISSFQLGAGSPAINTGMNVAAMYQEFGVTPPAYNGSPDLGWKESGSAPPPTPPPGGKVGDINEDGKVDIVDIGIAIDNYALTPIPNPKADINHDGKVDIVDIGLLIDNYGT